MRMSVADAHKGRAADGNGAIAMPGQFCYRRVSNQMMRPVARSVCRGTGVGFDRLSQRRLSQRRLSQPQLSRHPRHRCGPDLQGHRVIMIESTAQRLTTKDTKRTKVNRLCPFVTFVVTSFCSEVMIALKNEPSPTALYAVSLRLCAFVRAYSPPRACYALQRYTWYDFSMTRQPYPSDVSDAERAFVASTGSGAALPP